MTQTERFGNRDYELIYNTWHREASLSRFVSEEEAHLASLTNIDVVIWNEYSNGIKKALVLIETARDTGYDDKYFRPLQMMAWDLFASVLVVLYTPSVLLNPEGRHGELDIASFRVRKIAPEEWPTYRKMSPQEYATFLIQERYDTEQRIMNRYNLKRAA